jgi:signal transduction histidine kinase
MKKTTDKKIVDLMTNLPWGAHCCFFYETKEDLLDILVPYFQTGLLNNEFCIWVTSKFPQPEQAMRAMRKALPNFDSYVTKGQIEILPFTEWYVKEGVFDRQRVLAGWIEKFTEVSAKGYEGMRLTGDALWLEKTSWKNLTEYEAELDKTISNYRIKAVCTYFLDQCEASDIVDVAKNHGYALIKRGTWELIENSQRKRAEERAHEKAMSELEKAVELRTEELRRSQKQLRSLAAYLQSVREEERSRIARELHDEIGQALTGIKFSLERTKGQEAANVELGVVQALGVVNDLIGRVRDLSLELRPAMLDDFGLLAALRWHFNRYTSQVNIKVDFKHTGLEARRFAPEIETAAYRIVQEALTNVARHAGTDIVELGVRADENTLRIRVKDLGVGFDPVSVSARFTGGLSGMRERAIMLGGQLNIESAPGAGTLLVAELPLRRQVTAITNQPDLD